MIIFLLFSIGIINSQVIDDSSFLPASSERFVSNIGNYTYNSMKYDDKAIVFYAESCESCAFGVYPYNVDPPTIEKSSFGVVRYLKDLDTDIKKKNFVNDVQKSIQSQDFTSKMPFVLSAGITYNDIGCQIIIAWDSTRTFLILNEPNKTKDKFNITLGRGLNQFDSLKNMPSLYFKSQRLIFDISTNILVKIGCQNISPNDTSKTVLPLSLSSYRLHNLGGEKIHIQGPCYNELEPFPKLKIESLNNPNFKITDVAMTFNNMTNSFALISPSIWCTGLYEFTLSYKSFSFISTVEIYSIDDINQPFHIKDINKMKNWNYNKDNIIISIPDYESCVKISFYTADLSIIDKNKIPLRLAIDKMRIANNPPENQILLKDLSNSSDNILWNIGFLACSSASNELRWTNSFSLMCLYNYKFDKAHYSSQCKNFLSETIVKKDYYCPENLIQAKGLHSTFRNILADLKFFSDDFQKYDCYIQMTFSEKENGFTCCYNKATNTLIYGQDYYLRSNSIAGSYKWTFSPHINLLNHYIYDLLPLIQCCSFDNDTMCSELWDKHHSIKIKTYEEDLKGNVFGDPHFIPIKSASNYTYRAKGDFPLVTTLNNLFDLQARFFHEKTTQTSLLKAIVIRIQSIRISITLSSNNRTNLPWKILAETHNLSTIDALPFHHENVAIIQNSNKTKLDIYVKFGENYRIYIELERYSYFNGYLEYLNMRAHFSNNMKNIIIGGLFGKVDNLAGSTGLYPRNSDQPIAEFNFENNYENMYTFSQTWKLNESESLFFEKIDMPNADYQKITLSNIEECKNVKMCQIDRTYYMTDNIHLATKHDYDNRMVIDKEWSDSLSGKKFCDHPPIKTVRYDSDNFTENSEIVIVGCIDSNKTLNSGKYSLICERKSTHTFDWEQKPKITGDLCMMDKKTSGQEQTVVVYAAVGATVVVVLVLIFVILFFLIQRRRRTKTIVPVNKNLEASSSSHIPLEDFYDTVIKPENEYCTYAEIQKDRR